jgi:hypothetical protein
MSVLRVSRVLRLKADLPQFTVARFARRLNMAEEDRVKLFNWNLACVLLTPLPFLYMKLVDYHVSADTEMIYRTLDPLRDVKVKPDTSLFRA